MVENKRNEKEKRQNLKNCIDKNVNKTIRIMIKLTM